MVKESQAGNKIVSLTSLECPQGIPLRARVFYSTLILLGGALPVNLHLVMCPPQAALTNSPRKGALQACSNRTLVSNLGLAYIIFQRVLPPTETLTAGMEGSLEKQVLEQ